MGLINKEVFTMSILTKIYEATYTGNHQDIGGLVQKSLDDGVSPQEIINNALSKAMIDVGDKFGSGELYMPDMLLAVKAMKTAMDVIKPGLKGTDTLAERGTIVIGSVKGDLHDIGKNLVITMAEGRGFKVVDLGVNVDYQAFVDAVNEHTPQIVAFSGLLTTTLANIPDHIKALEDAGLRENVTLAVGGAPVTRHFADMYGIEIYADNASSAAKEFVKVVSQ
jgi:5-methyltetrahydrofolate--homocysteine methyltransferase